jgi:hypothetical protein
MKIPYLHINESVQLTEGKSELSRFEAYIVKMQAEGKFDKMIGDDLMHFARRIADEAWRKGAKEGFQR